MIRNQSEYQVALKQSEEVRDTAFRQQVSLADRTNASLLRPGYQPLNIVPAKALIEGTAGDEELEVR